MSSLPNRIHSPIFAARTCISYVSCSHCVIFESCESFSPFANFMISVRMENEQQIQSIQDKIGETMQGWFFFVVRTHKRDEELTEIVFQHDFTVFLQTNVVGFQENFSRLRNVSWLCHFLLFFRSNYKESPNEIKMWLMMCVNLTAKIQTLIPQIM